MSDTLSKKVDLALADLANGGKLNPDQADRFIRVMVDAPTILNSARVVTMTSSEMKVAKVGFGSRVLRAAPQGDGDQDSGANGRNLPAAQRSKPDLGQVQLVSKEVIAEVPVPYEFLEDNIEREGFVPTVLDRLAAAGARDLEELIVQGDTASADPYLALFDGALKQVTGNVVDAAGAAISTGIFGKAKKAIPTRFQSDDDLMRFYAHHSVATDWRLAVAARTSALGDAAITGTGEIAALGVPLAKAAKMPTSSILLTNPKNLIVGFQRNITLEQERRPRSRQVIFVLTARVGFAIEEQLSAAKVINLGD
ncbi:Phage-like element PBSX protein xkdG [Azospirillum argentinense]|uniref:phage major capsid protein n=1 Tax=Azospirillum argentinense TaxID=2970906 RepID=UPI0032DF57DA